MRIPTLTLNFGLAVVIGVLGLASAAQAEPTNTKVESIAGHVDPGTQSVMVNGAAANLSGIDFSADVTLHFGSNLIAVDAYDGAGSHQQKIITLYLDTTAQENCCNQTISGTLGDPQGTADVNGVAASINGSTFSASVPLNYGSNTLTATLIDSNSISSEHVINVFVTDPNAAPVINSTSPASATVIEADNPLQVSIQAQDSDSTQLYYRSSVVNQPLQDWQTLPDFATALDETYIGQTDLTLEVMDDGGSATTTDVPLFVVRQPIEP